MSYYLNTIWNGYRTKGATTAESPPSNCRNTIGNGYRS